MNVEKLTARLNREITRRIPSKVVRSRLIRSIASFTFDDFPKSAWTVAGALLAKYKAPGTYYVTASRCGTTIDGIEYYDQADLVQLHENGHEIGNHTSAHWRVRQQESGSLLTDVDENDRFVRQAVGDVTSATFSYPYGEASPRTKRLFSRRFACCRGTHMGLNQGWLDLGQLKAISLEMYLSHKHNVHAWIAAATQKPSWIIFFTHDISPNPSQYGSTPEMFENALARCRDANIDILTVKNAQAMACFNTERPGL